MSFRQYGGINYAAKNNIVRNNYSNANNLSVMTKVGQTSSVINSDSDININGDLKISVTGNGIYFPNGTFQSVAYEGGSGVTNYWTLSGSDIYSNNTGNVGIGTFFPVYKLDVAGTMRVNGNAILSGTNTINGYATLASPTFTGIPLAPTATAGTSSTQIATTAFVSESNYWTLSGNNIYSNKNGNVGIGTTNPLYKLEVTGTMRVGALSTLSAGLAVYNGLHVYTGATTLDGALSVTSGGLNVINGTTTLDGALSVTSGSTTLGNGLSVINGSTSLGGALTVTSATQLNSQLSVYGNTNVTGTTTLNGNLTVTSGSTTVQITNSDMTLSGVYPPPSDNSLVTKKYLDTVSLGYQIKQACQCATTSNLVDITGTGDGPFSTTITAIDGYTLSNNDRILVKDQSPSTKNGIFVYNTGTPNNTLKRADDLLAGSFATNVFVFVQNGTTDNAKTSFLQNTNPATITVGSQDLTFSPFSQFQVNVGENLTFSNNTLNVSPELINMTSVQFGNGTVAQTVPFVTLSSNPSGSYTNSNITVNAYGQITSASTGSSGGASYWSLNNDGSIYNNNSNNVGKVGIGTGATSLDGFTNILTVFGNTYLRDNVGIGTSNPLYNLDVTGNMRVTNGGTIANGLQVTSGTFTVTNSTNLVGGLEVSSGLNVLTNLTTLSGGLTVDNSGATNLGGVLNVTSGLTTLSGGLTVNSGATNLGGVLNVTGATILSAGLNVSNSGATSLTGTLTVTQNLTVDTDTLFVNASTNNVGIGTTDTSTYKLLVNGTTRINNKLSIFNNGGLSVTGDTTTEKLSINNAFMYGRADSSNFRFDSSSTLAYPIGATLYYQGTIETFTSNTPFSYTTVLPYLSNGVWLVQGTLEVVRGTGSWSNNSGPYIEIGVYAATGITSLPSVNNGNKIILADSSAASAIVPFTSIVLVASSSNVNPFIQGTIYMGSNSTSTRQLSVAFTKIA